MTAPLARRLAEAALDVRERPPAPPVVRRAQDLLRDYLGVALGGVPEASSEAVRRGLATLGAGTATVIGTNDRLPVAAAALANGAAAHALEMDDTFQAGSIHLGASVFSTALAAAELRPVTGDALVRAVLAGYEVGARLARAIDPASHYARGFHPTGTCGAFASATTAAVLLGLDARGVAAALGIAGSQAAGLLAFLEDGAWTKRFHPGWAANAGLHAAALAASGFAAPASVLEGRFGFLHGYSDAADATLVLDDPTGTPALMRTSIKPHACCRYAQGPIDAVLELRTRYRLRPADVRSIEVGVVEAAFPIICDPLDAKRRPTSTVDAQFSLPFSVATALVHGTATPEQYRPARFDDPELHRLMDATEPRRDPALDASYPAVWPTWVRATTRDGDVLEARVTHPRGDPENFPTDAELVAKFRTLAARVLDTERQGALLAAVERLPETTDARTLLACAVPTVN